MSRGINATSFYRLALSENNPGYVIAGSQDNSSFFYNNSEWRGFVLGDGMESLIHPDNPDELRRGLEEVLAETAGTRMHPLRGLITHNSSERDWDPQARAHSDAVMLS